MRSIPSQLLLHKSRTSTTLCTLIKIVAQDGTIIGMTSLDRDVVYNDGAGDIVYNSSVGFEPASIYYTSTTAIDNTEIKSLVPVYDFPLNEFDVNAGKWDYADFYMYEVNYTDLSMGHWTVMSGKMGETRSHDGIVIWGEMRSRMDQLKKPVCELDSLICRAKFGSQKGEEKFPCGFDTGPLWTSGTVSSLGVERNRVFSDNTRVEPSGTFEPGLMQFLTGKNAGLYVEIETYNGDTKTISLNFPTGYDIQVGDTFRIRVDCNKQARDSEKGCKKFWQAQWPLHFRGEPDIPVGDAGSNQTPGAQKGNSPFRNIELPPRETE